LLHFVEATSIIIHVNQVVAARIAANIQEVREVIDRAARQAGRQPNEIALVAVSKTFPAEAIKAAVAAGVTDIGESRIQEAVPKIECLGRIVRWHLIGHLQSNKVARAVSHFDIVQSIDSLELAEKISQHAVEIGKKIDGLMELNSSGEKSKYGFAAEEIIPAAERIAHMPGLNLRGLMTIGPLTDDEKAVGRAFEMTRQKFEQLQHKLGSKITVLSMGMSSDFELAIRCGSNMVRIGHAIFGEREKIN